MPITPHDDYGDPVLSAWNDVTGAPIPVHVASTVTGSDGKTYAVLDVRTSSGGATGDTIVTGTLTADQPTVGTPVAGGTVTITLGQGQGTVEAQLTGTFSGSTTVLFEGTDDAGVTTNWFTTFGQDTSVVSPAKISSITGPGPFLIRIPSAGYEQIRVRAHPFNTGVDSVAVRMTASVAGTGAGSISTNDGTFATQTTMAQVKTDLDTVVANTADLLADGDTLVTNTTGLATQTTLAAAKADLDTLVTNTADLLADGDHLATIDTSTAASKTDLDNLNTVAGTQADTAYSDATGATSAANNGLFKGLFVKLAAIASSLSGVLSVSGAVQAIQYVFNGGAPGNQNFDRVRSAQGLSEQTATISSGGGIGSTAPVLNVATGILPNHWILLTGGTEEWVLTTSTYVAGTTTLALTSPIVNASHTGAAWNAYGVRGPGTSTFLLEGVVPLILNTGSPSTGIFAQADASGFLKVNVAAGTLTTSSANVGLTGAASPTSAGLGGMSDGTNLQAFQTDSSTNKGLRVSLYGTNSTPGDTGIAVNASGVVKTIGIGNSGVNIGNVGLLSGTNVIGSTLLQSVSGTALGADNSNTELKVSLYGTNSTAGDTAIAVNASGVVKTLSSGNSGVNIGNTGGLAASGASNSGNPTKIGAVFNTAQPTVTNGQVVDAQATARGGLIVATGVDAFNVVVTNGNANGQTTMSASAPVAIASDQSKLPTKAASGDFVANSIVDLTTLIANTADLLVDGDNLANIPAKGTAIMTGSTPVTIATDDTQTTAIKNSVAAIPAKGTAIMTGSAPVTIATDDTQMTAIKNSVAAIPAKGTAVTSASTPVNIASDQVVPMKLSTVAVYSLASTTTSGSTQNSGDLPVGAYREISIDINTTAQAGTSPTIQYFYERKAADGIYYVLWQSAVLTAATNTLSTSIGAGMAYNQSLGVTGRLRWVVGGSATPTFTASANIQGK